MNSKTNKKIDTLYFLNCEIPHCSLSKYKNSKFCIDTEKQMKRKSE